MSAAHQRLPALPGRRIARAAAAAFALVAVLAAGGLTHSEAAPGSAPAAGKAACVEDTAFMRRNHMDLLQHQGQRTVRDGVRTTRHSLANCVDCHADKETGSVLGRNSAGKAGFCADCHAYVAVTTTCFECHSPKRGDKLAAGTGASR